MIRKILIAIIFISWQIKSQEKGYELENLISQLNDSELVAFNFIIDNEKEVIILPIFMRSFQKKHPESLFEHNELRR